MVWKPSLPRPAMPQPVPWTKATTPSIVGIVGEDAGAVDLLGDEAGDRGGAVHAGEHADIVAGADLAVRPPVAFEGAALFERQHVLGLGGFGEPVVAGEIVDAAIVLMDMLAGPDRHLGEADDLPEFQDRRPLGDRPWSPSCGPSAPG